MKVKLITILIVSCIGFSIMGVVDAGNIHVEVATRLASNLHIYDCDTDECIFKAELSLGDSKRSITIPEECKFHELKIHHCWSGGIASPKDSFVIVKAYNGGNMSLHFELDYWGSKAMTYSYVYGEYTNRNSDGNLISAYRVTKNQAHTKSYKNYTHRITWGENNQILYCANVDLNNTTNHSVGNIVNISGKMSEKNPSYNNVSYGNNLGGITFDLIISNGNNKETYKVTTRSDGTWSYYYKPQSVGTYTVEAYWKGNSTTPSFSPSTSNNNKKSFKVEKQSINSTINVPENTLASNPVQISGKSAPNLELELNIADNIGNKTIEVKTDHYCDWSTKYTPRTGGLHTVTVSLKNHYMYKDFTNTTTFNVLDNRINANSTINLPEEAIVNEEFIISGTLKDERGKTVPKVELNLTIQNENYTVTTDKNGYWSLLYTPTTMGKHTITISLTKHPYFYDFTNNTTFYVKNLTNSTINVPENTLASNPVQISGKSAPNLELELNIADNIGNKTIEVKTDHYCDWSTKYTPRTGGLHTVTVSLKNHYMYKDFTNTTTFNVLDNRINANSTINLPEEAIVNEEFMISGRVTPDKYVESLYCVPMDFSIKEDENNTVINKYGFWFTDMDGEWNCSCVLPFGEYTVEIRTKDEWESNSIFQYFSNTTTLTVI